MANVVDYVALKADILANTDPTVVQALADGNAGVIAAWYNGDASPAYWVLRCVVGVGEIRQAIDAHNLVDITAADLDRVMALLELRSGSGGEGGGELGFSGEVETDRTAWDDAFSSAAGDESQQAIAALWTRVATYAEVVHALSTGTGADAANADTTSWQGTLTFQDVTQALVS